VPAARLLLTPADLPSGWAVNPLDIHSSADCLGNESPDVAITSRARQYFPYRHGWPVLDEQAVTVRDPARALTSMTAALDKCSTFSYTNTDRYTTSDRTVRVTVTATMRRMSFPQYGGGSAAYLLSLTSPGTPTVLDVVLIIRQGDAIMVVALADNDTVDVAQLRQLTNLALARAKAQQAGG